MNDEMFDDDAAATAAVLFLCVCCDTVPKLPDHSMSTYTQILYIRNDLVMAAF